MEINPNRTTAVNAAATEEPNLEAQRVVFRVLSEYFGDAAYLAEYGKGADGVWEVDVTKLRHTEPRPMPFVVFNTFKGQVTQRDMYFAISRGQEKAGIPWENRIRPTMWTRELKGPALG